jgi:hypothetical protein
MMDRMILPHMFSSTDRRFGVIIVSLCSFILSSLNVLFHLAQFWTWLLLYIAAVNGAVMGLGVGWSLTKAIQEGNVRRRTTYVGSAVGILFALVWVNNQASVELYLNDGRFWERPPYITYVRFYLVGLALGLAKSFYYAIVPSVVIFWVIGSLLGGILKRRGTKGGRC